MKKLVTLLTLLLFTIGFEVAAIGLPNNAYIQQKAENHRHFSKDNVSDLFGKSNGLVVTKTNKSKSDSKKSALDSPADISTYTKKLVIRFVNFIAVTLLSLFSTEHSLTDTGHVFHNWFIADLPPQC